MVLKFTHGSSGHAECMLSKSIRTKNGRINQKKQRKIMSLHPRDLV